MHRLLKGLLCFLVLGLLSGCAATKNTTSSLVQKTLTIAHLGSKTPEHGSEKGGVCLLDPTPTAADATVAAAPADKAPVVQIPETAFDFGTVTDDKDLVHKFSIKNVGKSELKIKKVMPG